MEINFGLKKSNLKLLFKIGTESSRKRHVNVRITVNILTQFKLQIRYFKYLLGKFYMSYKRICNILTNCYRETVFHEPSSQESFERPQVEKLSYAII